MQVTLCRAQPEEKQTLHNLLEKYAYEFSQYDLREVAPDGLYGYKYLDLYWTEKNRWAYFILADGKLAGLVLVNHLPVVDDRPTDFQVAEFFVMHKYRRQGVGRQAFFALMRLHKGRWQLKCHPHNKPSVSFWRRVVDEYTHGQYEQVQAYPRTEYSNGTPGDVFFFTS